MTTDEARDIAAAFDENTNPSEEEIFIFTEAMNYLIEEEHNPRDMMYLGGYIQERLLCGKGSGKFIQISVGIFLVDL